MIVENENDEHRRHRSFYRGLHPLHRQRIRPAQRRGRVPGIDADRDRRDAGGPLLGVGRRRRRPRPSRQKDALRRVLRLPDRQLQRSCQDRLQFLRRSRPEGRGFRPFARPVPAARATCTSRDRRRQADPAGRWSAHGLRLVLREFHPDLCVANRLARRPGRVLHPGGAAIRNANRVQAHDPCRLRPRASLAFSARRLSLPSACSATSSAPA